MTKKREQEAELALRAQQGDRKACGELLLRYRPLMYRTALRHSPNNPEDLVQHCFATLMRRQLKAFDPSKGAFSTWVYRHILATILIAVQGGTRSERRLAIESAATASDTMRLEERQPAETDFCLEVSVEQLCRNSNLNARQKEVLTLRASGLTLREVGEQLGVTKERVRQIETVAKRQLQSIYAGCETLEDVHSAAEAWSRTGSSLEHVA